MKADDSSLDEGRRARIRKEALEALARADALGRFPTPVDDVLAVARLEVVEEDLADLPFLDRMRRKAGSLKRALSKVLGIFDVKAGLVFIDRTVQAAKQTFLKLHEIGHSFLPWQRDVYKVIEDCEGTLDPETADLFDREANLFATEVLFQIDGFIQEANDSPFGLKVPLDLKRKYGASAYAAIRQYVAKNHRACAVIVLNPPEPHREFGVQVVTIRRIITSESWAEIIGAVAWPETILPSHFLWEVIPAGNRKMSSPRQVVIQSRDGVRHKCIAEAFKTPYNTFILLQASDALTSRIVISSLPTSAKALLGKQGS
jgi:hypothetical protein